MKTHKLDDAYFTEILEGRLEWIKSNHELYLQRSGRKSTTSTRNELVRKLKLEEAGLREEYGYISTAEHGSKFKARGKSTDKLGLLLEKILLELYSRGVDKKTWRVVVTELETPRHKKLIDEVDWESETVFWGKESKTSFKEIRTRLTSIKKNNHLKK